MAKKTAADKKKEIANLQAEIDKMERAEKKRLAAAKKRKTPAPAKVASPAPVEKDVLSVLEKSNKRVNELEKDLSSLIYLLVKLGYLDKSEAEKILSGPRA